MGAGRGGLRAGAFVCMLCALVATSLEAADPLLPLQPLQDNSFLIEEAYNQEYGVLQSINSVTRSWSHADWAYTFSQEWPVDWDPRHQLSYTIPWLHARDFPGSGFGIGDVLLNWRYQLVGDGDASVAVTPRVSLVIPTGSRKKGRGVGGFGVQTNWALSAVMSERWVTHWNVGATLIPAARDADGNTASSASYNVGQSIVWLVRPRFNLLVETLYVNVGEVAGRHRTTRDQSLFVSPGLRWGWDIGPLQIVPGVDVPFGVGPSAGERLIFGYLSFEHPFTSLPAPVNN